MFGFALLAGLASCKGDYDDWGSPQANSQKELAEKVAMTAQPAVSSINMQTITGDSVQLVTVDNLAENQKVEYVLVLQKEDASDFRLVDMDAQGRAAIADINQASNNLYGMNPNERTLVALVTAHVTCTAPDGSTYTTKRSMDAFSILVTPATPTVETAYYMVGSFDNWSCTRNEDYKLVNGGGDVYEDPVFTITLMAPADATEMAFKVLPESAFANGLSWDNARACTSSEADGLSGTFSFNNVGTDFKFNIAEGTKKIRISMNMLLGTYNITLISYPDFIYEIGDESGWQVPHPLAAVNDNGLYEGFYYLNGEFKFKPNKDNWLGDFEWNGEGKISESGQSNCPDPGAGFYKVNVDLAAETYSLMEVTSITCVGNHNGWQPADANCHMTYNTELGCWEATLALTNGFKFAINDAWTYSWGGANGQTTAYDNLTLNNGKDLDAPEGDGTYLIQLYVSCEGSNRVVLTKQ